MAQMSAGQAVLESLVNEGCKYVFGIVGVSILDLVDPFYDRSDIRFITTRHEQGAVDMASAYARISGVPGVCMATGGPGASNFVGGIFNAYRAHAPVIALAGAAGTNTVLSDGGQEMDHVAAFRPFTKLAITIPKAERIPELMRHAYRVAMSGSKGPVLVDFPADLMQNKMIDADILSPATYRPLRHAVPDPALIAQAAGLLKQAKRPLILAGGGVTDSDCTHLVVQLAELLSIPMVTSSRHLDALPGSHPLNVGPFGQWGAPETYDLSAKADVILGIGTRLGGFGGYLQNGSVARDARIIQIEMDEATLGRNCPVEVSVHGDARAAVQGLLDLLRAEGVEGGDPAWRREADAAKAKRNARHQREDQISKSGISPHRFYDEFAKVQTPDMIVVTDSGAVNTFGWERHAFERPRTFIASPTGAIGHAVGEAMGAKLARPDAPVISIAGDGGFLYNAHDLETAVREHIATVNIVVNNNLYGQEKALQKARFGDRIIGAELTNPRFDKLAELYGAKGYYVERLDQLGDAIRAALSNKDVPSVIEVPVDPDDLPIHGAPRR